MKFPSRFAILGSVLLILTDTNAQESAGPREQFQAAVAVYQKTPTRESALKVIELSKQLDPPPAVPEEARRPFVMGLTILQESKDSSAADKAAGLFTQATNIAPWWAEARYNLAVADEIAGRYPEAIAALKLYLVFALADRERREAQDKVYALEAKAEMAATQKTEAIRKQQAASLRDRPRKAAEAMVASLRKTYSGQILKHQICGVTLNQYWMSTEAQAQSEKNWTDHEKISNIGSGRVYAVEFDLGGVDHDEIQMSLSAALQVTYKTKNVFRGVLDGDDPNKIAWTINGLSWGFKFAKTTSGQPMLTQTYSCGEKGCRRERLIFAP